MPATLYNSDRIAPGGRRGRPAGGLPARALAVALAACAALAAGAGCGTDRQPRPNVLLVVISGVRADHVSAYGYGHPTTPTIDALAAQGTLYENAITAAPWPPTAQASILTGLFPPEHAVVFDHPVLETSVETLAETLSASGYAAVAVSTHSEMGAENGFGQGFESFFGIRPAEEGSPDDGAARAEAELQRWLDQRAGTFADRPFFAWVSLTNPMLPFNPPGEYQQKFLQKPVPLPRLEELSQVWLPWARRFSIGMITPTTDEMGAIAALYDGEIAYADYRLGRIVDHLLEMEILDDTLVIVTSDVGEDLGDHGLIASASSLYDTMIRVPLVMRLPGRVAPGRRVSDQVQTLDLKRAIEALSREDAPADPAGDAIAPRPVAISEARFDPAAIRYYRSILPGAEVRTFERNLLAVRTATHKYVLSSLNMETLFDLARDPGEQTPVIAAEPARAADLRAQIGQWAATLRPPPGAGVVPQGAAAP